MNSDSAYAKVVCRGDSGGGLVIPQVKNDKKIYYLQGVVSNSQSTVNCDTSFVALFTNVQEFKNMINGAIKKTPFEEN